ncbi:MAG: zf-HC2 domain-containing protein [Nocardioidaceae bacterium]
MNDPVHPPVDLLADHHEGLVTDAQAAAVSAHLDSCAECLSLVSALDEVSDVLRADGRRGLSMPASVATSLDQTLERVAAERANGVPGLVQRRADDASRTTKGPRRPAWPMLAAAAAVAVIATAVGVGVVLEDNGGSADSSQADAGSTADNQAVEGDEPGSAAASPEEDLTSPGSLAGSPIRARGSCVSSLAVSTVGPRRPFGRSAAAQRPRNGTGAGPCHSSSSTGLRPWPFWTSRRVR